MAAQIVLSQITKIDPLIKEYYVKTQGVGKGDGSSWDNAIGEKDFAFVFKNLQTEGVTFYVAAGTYHAVYNRDGEETNDKTSLWVSEHGANIYGGYSPKATGTASTTKAYPDMYRTIFTGDINGDDRVVVQSDCEYKFENFTDNAESSLLKMNISSDVRISGIELTGMSFSKGTSPAMLGITAAASSDYEVTVDHCKLYVADKGIEAENVGRLVVDQSEFYHIRNAAVFSNRDMKVSNSTFTHTNGVLYHVQEPETGLVVENSTFVKNISDVRAYNNDDKALTSAKINNNTFISCEEGAYFELGDNMTATVEGNIFAGTKAYISKSGYETKQQTFTNNLLACETLELRESGKEKDNVKLESATTLYKGVFDGLYSDADAVFSPNLTYKGAATRTVALLKDALPDGTSIRFPRLEKITKDQRGVSRLDNTCMGAYEIECSSDTIFTNRTIMAGGWFDGKEYDKMGRYDVVSYDTTSYGCDSIVVYRLEVVPDSSIKEFYVKKQGTGKEDGSDWDNAIGEKDFAFVFKNLQTEGVTFYVAAGTYHAVYNRDGEETNDKTSLWVSEHGANIYGGYSPKATGTASTTKAYPDMYRTIFTGDINGDDRVVVQSDCEYKFENFTDNAESSLLKMNISSDVRISGIELTGMSFSKGTSPAMLGITAAASSDYEVTVDHCKLYVADKGIEAENVGRLVVDQSEFYHIRNAAVFSNRDMKVSNSTFTHTNGVLYHVQEPETGLVVENSTFVKNISDVRAYNNDDKALTSAKINNNTFISCEEGAYFELGDNMTATVEGNIFAGTKAYISKSGYETKQQTFTNNLLACETLELRESGKEKDNVKLESATTLYKGVFDGLYSDADAVFSPNLTYKGAATRTVALLKDALPDGTSIRFPRLEKITKDQRGVSRLDNTCMGAYEKDEETGAKVLNDAICEIYPNPVKKVLNVNGCEESFSYEIIDLTGRTVSSGKSSGTIAVAALSNGVYFLKLQSANQQACLRFVKQ